MHPHDMSHEPVFCFLEIPTKLDLSFGDVRRARVSFRLPWDTMVRSSLLWSRSGILVMTLSQFTIPGSLEDKFWDSFFDVVLGPYDRPFETLQEVHDFQTVCGMTTGGGKTGTGKGVPNNPDGMIPRYLSEEGGFRGKSRWSHPVVSVVWWEYWEPVCLSTSTDHF
jgi:hypothetical protein